MPEETNPEEATKVPDETGAVKEDLSDVADGDEVVGGLEEETQGGVSQ